jgi:hypothetical protein
MKGQIENDSIVRQHLLTLLKGNNAHKPFEEVVRAFPVSKINTQLPGVPYSAWHLIEHLRITQWDILDFIRNPNYKYIKWPEDYWPAKAKKANEREWKKSVAMFIKDNNELKKIVASKKTDLYGKIPHGKGQTILREILLVADHNSYHIGEFVVLSRAIRAWKN